MTQEPFSPTGEPLNRPNRLQCEQTWFKSNSQNRFIYRIICDGKLVSRFTIFKRNLAWFWG
jgi:hypothetical protein